MSKDSRKDSDKDRLTPIIEYGADTLQRVEIITGTGPRRRWSTDAKAAIVAESQCKRVRGGAATRHQSKSIVSLASPGHAGAGRGARGQRHASCLCAGRDHRLRGQSRSRSARFASMSGEQSTGGHSARCSLQSGGLVDVWLRPGLSIWIATQPVDFRRGMDSLTMLVSGERGLWSRSVPRRTLCLPLQAPRSREDPDLGWKRSCSLLQKNRGAVHLAAHQGRRHAASSCSALGAAELSPKVGDAGIGKAAYRGGAGRLHFHPSRSHLTSCQSGHMTGATGDTTTTDSPSQRDRASRRGGQLLTRARGSSNASACPHLRAPGASVPMVAPYATILNYDLEYRSGTSAPRNSHTGYQPHRKHLRYPAPPHDPIEGMPIQQDRARDGLQTGRGRSEKLASARWPPPVAKTHSRCDNQQRDRGHRKADRPSAQNRRRLTGLAVTKIWR
jgi:hypothetical protein